MTRPSSRALDTDVRASVRTSAAGWLGWLGDHTDSAWRVGEWDQATLLFTGDLASLRTAAWPCQTPGCPTATRYHHRRCETCRRTRAGLGVDWGEFDAAPPSRRIRPLQPSGQCAVPDCRSEVHCRGMCFRHERAWRGAGKLPVAEFVAAARPFDRGGDCAVAGCVRERVTRAGLCRSHGQRLARRRRAGPMDAGQVSAWITAERPRLGVHQFSLAGLGELPAAELLYALQCRDQSPPPMDPTGVRILLARLDGVDSLRHADPQAVCESGGTQYNSSIRGTFRDLRGHLDRAFTQYSGVDPFAGDVWQVALLGLQPNASRRWPATLGVVDFRPLTPTWLRQVVQDWAQTVRPDLQRLRETLRACQVASHTLALTGPVDPADLGTGDFTRIIGAIVEQRRDDGSPYSAGHRNLLLHLFCQVIEHGRAAGLMAVVPDPFRPVRARRVRGEPNEDELGKALPEKVITQLDAHLDLLGPRGRSGVLTADDLQAMHQCIYQLLRDTGRRPGEIVSLHTDCLETIGGQHNLIYDNHKAGRMRRRLPITTDTARMITVWRQRRTELRIPAGQEGWLFPTPMLRARQTRGHVTPACVNRAFKAWTGRIGVIDSEILGPDGTPAPFDPTLVAPYALRHSYAQRHADAGVPVDVLKELMDHAAVDTTMGYYTIGLKRKQQAIAAVGAHAINAAGVPAPFTTPTAYQRSSVAVPFGNCTEPSNVTAGGGACPIRFQCAGCGFYRPDPSHLPAVEQHVADLRADRETASAIGAADYVITNMNAEIAAFTRVAHTMRARLDALPADERDRVEAAAGLLRAARAGRSLPIVPITRGHSA